MRRLFALITALLLIFAPAAAQSDTDAPRPPLQAYLDTAWELPLMWNAQKPERFQRDSVTAITNTILYQLENQYTPEELSEMSYTDLSMTYMAVTQQRNPFFGHQPDWNWAELLFKAWANKPTASSSLAESFMIGNLSLREIIPYALMDSSTHHDFDGNTFNDRIYAFEDGYFIGVVVFMGMGQGRIEAKIIELTNIMPMLHQSYFLHSITDAVNGDLPKISISEWIGAGMGGGSSYIKTYQWRDEDFVLISSVCDEQAFENGCPTPQPTPSMTATPFPTLTPDEREKYDSEVAFHEFQEMQYHFTDTLEEYALFDAIATAQHHLQYKHLDSGRIDNALTVLDAALDNAPAHADPLILDGVRYWQALALDAAGRLDEAQAIRQSILTDAPDSPWARLSALYFSSEIDPLTVLKELAANYYISPMKGDDLRLSSAVMAEFTPLLSSLDTNFNTRVRAFTFNGEVRWSYFDVDTWAQTLIREWLTLYPQDFSLYPEHTIGDLTISAHPKDFNADGIAEWVLNVTTESGQYRQILFVAGEIGALELVDSPLPWSAVGSSLLDNAVEPQLFQDLTGDGQPEWVVAIGNYGSHQKWGYLQILQWRNDEIVDISDIGYSAPAGGGGAQGFPYGVNIEYTDLDSNGTTEIVLRQNQDDNWGCLSEWVMIYEWRVGLFKYVRQGETEVTFQEDEIGCILKNAHIAFWEGRYPDAIRDYRRFLNRTVTEELPYQLASAEILHARVKLAAAYAFMNQPRDAANTLDKALRDLALETHDIAPIDTLVRAAHTAYQADSSPLSLCMAMYTVFQDYQRYEALAVPYWGLVSYLGIPASSSSAPRPDSARAGCDAPAMIAASPDSPESQIAAETLRQADERYAYQRLLWRVRDFKWSLTNSYTSDSLTESESERPAYLSIYQSSLKQRLDLTRADLEKFADDPIYGAVVRYHYAWALDDAGFFDDSEVAAAYQSVIDFAPESPWASLAALHVE